MRNFHELLAAREDLGFSLCVGLDPDNVARQGDETEAEAVLRFCRSIVHQTHRYALCFKINWAFFLKIEDLKGLEVLRGVIAYINEVAPTVPVIIDCKVGDIGNTNLGYANLFFDQLGGDAITVHNYMGAVDGMQPLLDRKEKGIIVLCRTSNAGGAEFQDFTGTMHVDIRSEIPYASVAHAVREAGDDVVNWLRREEGVPLYIYVAERVQRVWNGNNNCYMVVGATQPAELAEVRRRVPRMKLLIPGLGAQGGDALATVFAGVDERMQGIMVNNSRGILKSSDPMRAAREFHEMVTGLRVMAFLDRHEAVLTGRHFVFTSGNHGTAYINMRAVAHLGEFTDQLGTLIHQACNSWAADFYVGPETLGRNLAQAASRRAGNGFVWCDIQGDGEEKTATFSEKLGFGRLMEGKRVVVVDDLLTTGSSVKAVIALLHKVGATIVGVAVVVRRSPEVTADTLGVPKLTVLANIEGFLNITAEECAATGPCSNNVPMVLRPGHGHKWIESSPGYPVAT